MRAAKARDSGNREEESQESAAQSALAQRQPAEKEPPNQEADQLEEPPAAPSLIQRQPDHVPASVKKALQLGDGRPMNRTTRASMYNRSCGLERGACSYEQRFSASRTRHQRQGVHEWSRHPFWRRAVPTGYTPGSETADSRVGAHDSAASGTRCPVPRRISQPGEPLQREADAVASRIDGNQAVTQPSVGARATASSADSDIHLTTSRG